jgi:hypothetical protein
VASFNYARSAATADRLIKRFGQVSQLSRSVPGNGPAHNPGPGTPLGPFPVTIVPLPIDTETKRDGVEPETLDFSKIREFYLSPKAPDGSTLGIEPRVEDVLEFDNYPWTIRNIAPLNPGAVIVFYHGECKRS